MALVGAAAIGSTDPLTKQATELGVSAGSIDHAAEVQAHSKRARTLAGEGKLVDAEAAFEEGLAVANRERLRLLELLTLREMKKYVLDGLDTALTRRRAKGRGGEADKRMEVIDDPLFAVDGVQMGAPIAELDALTELDAEEVLRGDKAARLAEEARLAREAQERALALARAQYQGSSDLLAKIDAKLTNTDREYGLFGPPKVVVETRPSSRTGSRPSSREGSRPSSRPGSRAGSREGSRPSSRPGSRPGSIADSKLKPSAEPQPEPQPKPE